MLYYDMLEQLQHFGTCAYSLSRQVLDEKSKGLSCLFTKYGVRASSQLALDNIDLFIFSMHTKVI